MGTSACHYFLILYSALSGCSVHCFGFPKGTNPALSLHVQLSRLKLHIKESVHCDRYAYYTKNS